MRQQRGIGRNDDDDRTGFLVFRDRRRHGVIPDFPAYRHPIDP